MGTADCLSCISLSESADKEVKMNAVAKIIAVAVLLFSPMLSTAFGGKGDYLTDDGKLQNTLEVTHTDSRGIVLHELHYTIEADGTWIAQWSIGPEDRTKEGVLSKEQLESLAGELARYNLKGLKPSDRLPLPDGPTIKFGEFGGESIGLFPPDSSSIGGRLGGIFKAVEEGLGNPFNFSPRPWHE